MTDDKIDNARAMFVAYYLEQLSKGAIDMEGLIEACLSVNIGCEKAYEEIRKSEHLTDDEKMVLILNLSK